MKNLRYFLAILATAATCFGASAVDVAVDRAGTLSKLVADPSSVTELTLTGNVNAADLFFVGNEMKALKTLDLGGVKIEAYSGKKINGHSRYAANTVPVGVFADLGVTSVVLPVTPGLTVGDCAFAGTALTDVSLGANVDSVGMGAFNRCPYLTNAVLPKAQHLGTDIFADCSALQTADVTGCAAIPASTFRNCPSLKSVSGTEGVVTIGDAAFMGDTALEAFAFGSALIHVGDDAFAGTGLSAVDLSAVGTSAALGDRVFAHSAVTEAVLPAKGDAVPAATFFDASALQSVTLPATAITIGCGALKGTSVKNLTLPADLKEIGDYALAGVATVDTLVLPAALVRVGDHAMENMTGLAEINATALVAVPQTGSNVWAGVDQPKVGLSVMGDYASDFSDHDQWGKFNIHKVTAAEDITADAATEVSGRFDGADLRLIATAPMTAVRVFDASGRQVAFAQPAATDATIADAATQPGVYVVHVLLDGDAPTILKLARR